MPPSSSSVVAGDRAVSMVVAPLSPVDRPRSNGYPDRLRRRVCRACPTSLGAGRRGSRHGYNVVVVVVIAINDNRHGYGNGAQPTRGPVSPADTTVA